MVQKYKTSDINLFGKINLSENVTSLVKKNAYQKEEVKRISIQEKGKRMRR